MQITAALVDELRPAVAQWLAAMTPTGMKALRQAAMYVRRQTVPRMRAQLHRRTGKRAPLQASSIGLLVDRRGGHPYAALWFRRGILAAHELGSTIPGGVMRPKNIFLTGGTSLKTRRAVLAWGGSPGAREHFATQVMRRSRTLRRRPMLEPAYRESEAEVLRILDEAYELALGAGSTGAAVRERIGG